MAKGRDTQKKVKKKSDKKNEKKSVSNIRYQHKDSKDETYVTINKKDKKEFMEKLKLSNGIFAKIKKKKEVLKDISLKSSFYTSFSNKLFRKTSDKIIR